MSRNKGQPPYRAPTQPSSGKPPHEPSEQLVNQAPDPVGHVVIWTPARALVVLAVAFAFGVIRSLGLAPVVEGTFLGLVLGPAFTVFDWLRPGAR